MLDLDLSAIGAAWYAGNGHKWLCAPKGAGMLYTREDKRGSTRPVVISHGANATRADRSRYLLEFDWVGTTDPTPWLCLPKAIETLGGLHEGGWPQLRAANRRLVLDARRLLAETVESEPPCSDAMIGSLASLRLPDGNPGAEAPRSPLYTDPLQDALLELFRVEVPIIPWPEPPKRILRISGQAYNAPEQYAVLAGALGRLLRS
jgi:isopenicillin-N epimerase